MNHGLRSKEGHAVPLEAVRLSGEILGDRARLVLRQVYRNREAVPIEAIYTFPLPPDAVLAGFRLVVDGRELTGELRAREKAEKLYHEALLGGDGATLLERERADVHTLSVGNLRPGGTVEAELELLVSLEPEAGSLRLAIPTLVAPRYVPGVPSGGRTGDGVAPPTDRVPDADRITPPIGDAPYRLELDLELAGPEGVTVSSPSHAIEVQEEGGRRFVRFAGAGEPLDRDLVLRVEGHGLEAAATARLHRAGEGPSTLAVTVAPPAGEGAPAPLTVALAIDVSGSMAGASIEQARRAARLCLRQLRQGDRFHLLGFDHRLFEFRPEPLLFDERSLAEADLWIDALQADGGTELGGALVAAVRAVPRGAVLVLTDGQVGQEEEILGQLEALGELPRISSIGIGTVVTTTLLDRLARRTGGAVEQVHPGERIEPKVVAQFARLTLPAWIDVRLDDGSALEEVAPKPPWTLLEGEPFTFFAHLAGKPPKHLRLSGLRAGERRSWSVPVRAGRPAARPELMRFHAALRLRDLEETHALLTRRRARSGNARTRAAHLKRQIVALSIASGVISRFTAWVAVEKRAAADRTDGLPETRVVPVAPAAGWEMLATAPRRAPIGAPAGAYYAARPGSRVPRGAPYRKRRPAEEIHGSLRPSIRPPDEDAIFFDILARQDADGLWSPPHGEVSLAARLAFTLRMLGLIERRVLADNRWAERNVERALRAILDALQTFDADPALATKLLDWIERLIFLTGSWTYLRGEISLRRQAGAAQSAGPLVTS